jgi:hypothetical protein
MNLLFTIERHLRHRSVAPSRFGREATGDPRFVFDRTAAKVLGFIAHAEVARNDSVGLAQAKIARAGAAEAVAVVSSSAPGALTVWHNAATVSQEIA